MITTQPSPAARNRKVRGYTLVEVLIASSLATLLMVAVLTTFLFVGRSAANVRNYSDMETEARMGLERFGRDARQANSINWINANSIRLSVQGTQIVYTYDTVERAFTRTEGGNTTSLITGIQDFQFIGNMINGDSVNMNDLAQASAATKQIQIYVEARRATRTATAATNTVLSARFILRNKRVTA
jgi:type II secretory pathway pseudopilin PulG